jgi:diguanylate cyclase (GGDEF)-like protein
VLRQGVEGSGTVDLGSGLDADLLDELAATFGAADASVQQHLDLVDAAAADVNAIVSQLDADAASDVSRVLVLTAVVTGLAIAGAALAVRSIVRPLRRISAVADDMRDGSLETRAEVSGPRELQSAARALNEAIDQVQLSERQALALAEGDLDNPVLAAPTPGALGRSLRDAVAQLASSMSEREDFRRRLAHEAAHDGLTGLPNRPAILSHVERAIGRSGRTGATVALLMVDLHQFKLVNETHGHIGGDRVLVEVSSRLRGVVRQGDVVGRVGADEFLVVAEPVQDADEAHVLAERLLLAIEEEMLVAGTSMSIGASIGISLATQESDPDGLLREASAAAAAAKRHGRGGIHFCDDELRSRLASRGEVERGLIHAIEHDELVVHVQELVRARDEQVVSMEALVRWIHPERGLIPPNDFIPVAEESDLIISLDRWVLERAGALLADWAADGSRAGQSLAVNISERHLGHPHLVEHVLGPLRRHGVDPSRLTIEVTETALLEDLAVAARQLGVLRAAGVKVAIDDFGTGYTSLAHLRALPVDILKIDRSFVSNLARDDERTLVRMIVEIGHLFGHEVVAEGVETSQEARELLGLGVDTLQGFHYSRPSLVELRPAPSLAVQTTN